MMNSFLERDLRLAEERGFAIKEATHEKFGDGYLITVDATKAQEFGGDHFQNAIPMFSLDAFLFFLPKNEPRRKNIPMAFEPYGMLLVSWPSFRAFHKDGTEIRIGRGPKDSFIFLSGFSPMASEYWLKANFKVPGLTYHHVASVWICIEGKDLIEKGISPGQALHDALQQNFPWLPILPNTPKS
jgi:hypothetical protein